MQIYPSRRHFVYRRYSNQQRWLEQWFLGRILLPLSIAEWGEKPDAFIRENQGVQMLEDLPDLTEESVFQ